MPHGLRVSCANLVITIPDLEGVQHRQFIPAGSLVLPVRDVDCTLHSLQFISPAGDKQFLYGGRVAGCCYGLGALDQHIWLCEGFATGATVFEATHEAVAVCFFAGNLQHVAEELRRKYPRAELIICADNDRKTLGNPGIGAAKAVARRFMLRAVWPVFEEDAGGTDFNDLAQQIGIVGVRKELQKA
jgi:putative DNA primase/helicase